MFLIPVAPLFEERTIVLAQGLGFTNAQFRKDAEMGLCVPDAIDARLKKKNLALEVASGTTASFFSVDQGVLYHLKLIYEKGEFKEALETPGIALIYSGHSRIGR